MILGSCDPEILGVSEVLCQAASDTLRSWCDQPPGILGVLEHLGVELFLGVVELAAELAPKVCSGHL